MTTKIDRRRNYFVVLDTETCNGIATEKGLDLSQSLVYDLGYAIVDKHGTVYEKKSFVIWETFCGMKDVMSSAYYADKIPTYWEQIKTGERKLTTFYNARMSLLKDMEKYNTTIVCAHNAEFDVNALNNTQRWLTKSKYRWFFRYGTTIWDSLSMAKDTIGKQKTYKNFCVKNGYMTRHKVPQVRLTAEILYRYITNNLAFEESHTGLEDVMIEKEIVKKCFCQHKKMKKTLY